jgi:hypothetical protein
VNEPLRVTVFRRAETGPTELPVVAREHETVVGSIALADLLTARPRTLEPSGAASACSTWLRRAG